MLLPDRWRLFVAATIVIAATPGPNMLLVMTSSVKNGFARSLATMAGCLTGVLAMIGLSALGLGALLEASPALFRGLKAAGAAYLFYLGVRMWLDEPGGGKTVVHGKGLYREGLLVSLSNPKAILFAAAFLPQFVDPALEKAPQFAALVAMFCVIEVACYFAYALGGRQAAVLLARPRARRWFDRGAGALFAAFAAAMALS